MDEHSQYFVLYPDETRGFGSSPSSAIPTLGAATTALDLYRTVAVDSANLHELDCAFTDTSAVAAISRVAEGGITDVAELEAAEVALQALLLHHVVHILVPSPKVDYGNGLVTYIRPDNQHRTQFGFDLFALTGSRDWLVAPEFLKCEQGKVRSSTLADSPLTRVGVESVRAGHYSHKEVIEGLNVAAEMHQVPAYFTSPSLVRSRRGDGFSKRFYHHMRQSWDEAVSRVPPVVCTFALPPLLAVVLNRVNNREDLKQIVRDLRAELAPVRNELTEFNNIVTQSTSNAEIEARTHHIVQSFDAIIPESRLSGVQRRQRRILSIQRLARPLIRFAMGFLIKNGVSFEDGLNAAHGAREFLETNELVDRTITAQTFAGLLKTESLQSLVKQLLTQAEITSIEKSIRARKLRS